jgi:GPH family glycoside/pentoside/hexuronide:cation symporter|tara:strand:+ start:190 stop:1611 length:1422 start_codon:yes stop_codon:yes gene_type:complete
VTEQSLPDGSVKDLSATAVGAAGVERLSSGVIWAYSMPRISLGIMGLLFGTYLMKFATDVLLIAPAAMGALIAVSRIWDGVSDPLAGYLSDRTRSRFGRRRTWMFAAAVPMSVGLVMIWSPPSVLDGMMIVIWMAVALFVYESASTAFFVPYGALGVELTPNYHERTRLYGYSHMIGAIGSFLGLISLYLMDSSDDKRTAAIILSSIAGFAITGVVLGSTLLLPERNDYQGRGATNPFKSFADVFRNPHALLLLIVYAIETFGAASIGMLVPYLSTYVIPVDEMPVNSSLFMVSVLVVYTVPQFAFTPLWIRLSVYTGKKLLWAISMGMSTAIFIGYFFSLEFPILIWILSFALGTVSGIGAVVAPAIQADIIDYDEYVTGERKEGTYYAVWNMIRKGAASLTAVITGFVLQLIGFEPNVEQTESTKFAMRALFAWLPAGGYLIGTILFLRFTFNEKEHTEIRRILAERNTIE